MRAPLNAHWRGRIPMTLRSRCKKCGHETSIEVMTRVHWEGRLALFCPECHLELVEKRTGYRQGKLQLDDHPSDAQDGYPF